MEAIRKTYVSFEFSPFFISENQERENNFSEEEDKDPQQYGMSYPGLEPGTLDRVLEQYEEIEVQDRFLSNLKVPKGALCFYFYERMVGIAYVDGEATKMYSDPIEKSISVWYYLQSEGEVTTREELEDENCQSYHQNIRNHLLDEMDEKGSDRLFETEGGNFNLQPDDVIVKTDQVQMIDTEIEWPVPWPKG